MKVFHTLNGFLPLTVCIEYCALWNLCFVAVQITMMCTFVRRFG
uniref:Uncharacterized protein n=1 Tax=Anguilla anguilla TaxID=7936 RepID=A0A0E9RZP2_ANGAN